jgi:hypothetical protein
MISLTGVNAIIAFPFYDNFAITSVIISFSLIIYSRQKKYFSSIKIIAGLVCFTPLLFKQNIGLFYLFGLIVVLSLQVIKSGYGPLKSFLARKMFPYLLGASFALALLLVLFLGTPYRKEIFYDTFTYSGKIKGVFTKTELFNFFDRTYIFIGLIILCIVSIFKYRVVRIVHLMFLIITLLVSLMGIYLFAVNQSLGLFNFGTPKLVSLWILALGIPIFFCRSFEIVLTNKSFEYLILVCLFVLFGAYLSQGFSGSSYAVGPIILIVLLSQFDAVKDSSGKILTYLSFLGILSYAVWVQLYGLSGLQLQNPNLTTGKHAGHFGHDTFSYLGIAKNDMQDLIDLRKEIFDYKGSVIQVPAEDPLPFLLNNYKPWGRCSQNIFVVCTSANRERMRIIDSPPSLIIVKKLPQWTFDWEPLSDQIIIALEKCNTPSKIIGRYLLYEKFKLNDCFVSTLRHEITRVL